MQDTHFIFAGLACLMQSAYEGELRESITSQRQTELQKIRKKLLGLRNADESSIPLAMFRIGSGPQVVRSLRIPLETL